MPDTAPASEFTELLPRRLLDWTGSSVVSSGVMGSGVVSSGGVRYLRLPSRPVTPQDWTGTAPPLPLHLPGPQDIWEALWTLLRHNCPPENDGESGLLQLPPLFQLRELERRLRQQALRLAVQSAALDHGSVAVMGLDAEGQLLYLNRAAQTLLRAGEPLRAVNGQLRAAQSGEQANLNRAVQHLAAGQAELQRVAFQRPDAPPLTGVLLPVQAQQGEGHLPGAFALLLKEPGRHQLPPQTLLEQLFHLTPAEARSALLMAEGRSIEECAAQLDITVNTFRNHLKRVFSKTATHRQGELVRLILTLL